MDEHNLDDSQLLQSDDGVRMSGQVAKLYQSSPITSRALRLSLFLIVVIATIIPAFIYHDAELAYFCGGILSVICR